MGRGCTFRIHETSEEGGAQKDHPVSAGEAPRAARAEKERTGAPFQKIIEKALIAYLASNRGA